jgi:hypothetical protein
VRLGCCIYQIFKESDDGNKLSNNIAEFEDLYNVAAVTQLSVDERVRLEACYV